MIIRIDYQEPDVMLDLWGGTTGVFDGFDRFNRITDQRWLNYNGGSTDLDRTSTGMTATPTASGSQNTVSKSEGSPVYMDEYYTYDSLNRLTNMARGTLTGGPPPTGIGGTPTEEQDWTLDTTGNWSGFVTRSAEPRLL